jgi:hypothetical protein
MPNPSDEPAALAGWISKEAAKRNDLKRALFLMIQSFEERTQRTHLVFS